MSIINIDNLFNKINFNRSIEEKSLYTGQDDEFGLLMTEKYFNEATVEQLSLEIMINNFESGYFITEIAKPLIGTEREDIYYKLKDVLSQEGFGDFVRKVFDGFFSIIEKIINGFKSLIDSILDFFGGRRSKERSEKYSGDDKQQKVVNAIENGKTEVQTNNENKDKKDKNENNSNDQKQEEKKTEPKKENNIETTIKMLAYKKDQPLYGAFNSKFLGVDKYVSITKMACDAIIKYCDLLDIKDRDVKSNRDEANKLLGMQSPLGKNFNSVFSVNVDLLKSKPDKIVNNCFYGSENPQNIEINTLSLVKNISSKIFSEDFSRQIKEASANFKKVIVRLNNSTENMKKRAHEYWDKQDFDKDEKLKNKFKGEKKIIQDLISFTQNIGGLSFSFYKNYKLIIIKMEKIYKSVLG